MEEDLELDLTNAHLNDEAFGEVNLPQTLEVRPRSTLTSIGSQRMQFWEYY